MYWDLEKLEREREELLEVIRDLRKWERFSIDDRQIIALSITGHMMRLGALEEEISAIRSEQINIDIKDIA